MISSREVEIPLQCTREPSAELWSLLCAMLTKNPVKRIILKDVATHRFWDASSKSESGNRKAFSEDNPEPISKPTFVSSEVLSPIPQYYLIIFTVGQIFIAYI